MCASSEKASAREAPREHLNKKEGLLIRRPAVWILASLLLLLSVCNIYREDILSERYYILDDVIDDQAEAEIEAKINYTEKKNESVAVYLKDVTVNIKDKYCHFSRLLAYSKKIPELKPGNKIYSSGKIMVIEEPSNPGQFNLKEYYREKNIYYKFICDSLVVTDNEYNPYLNLLQNIKCKISNVYKTCLPSKEYGIINAMILGDKSLLDMDIRKLYQANGIGHLLAISALHITIICSCIYKLLILIKLPKELTSFFTIVTLIAYGNMTGFSIPTSRAVIMMVLSIFASLIGRSYDTISAAAISAVIILIQKPFSLFSCSFLLSFGSILGISLIYPRLLMIIYGGEAGIRHNKRVRLRQIKEGKGDKISIFIRENIIHFKICLSEMFLSSLSIQLSTVPIILYFFYEYPLYGVFINLIVIPLASLLVILAAAGGITGIVCMAAARFIFGGVYYLLKIYETICNIANSLPFHIIVTGKPSILQIIIYYIILVIILKIISKNKDNSRFIIKYRMTILISAAFSLMILFYTYHYNGLYVAFLDVGQGDCIFIRSPSGQTYMIDGGSSDIKSVGEYRILPFLRYNGIDKLDYIIMTHADDDHISGLTEIINQSDKGDIHVHNMIFPNPSDKCKDASYNDMVSLCKEKNIKTHFINTGDKIHDKYIDMTCLNPSKNFESESANAYSTVISLIYGKNSYIFMGDVEKEGEEDVLNILSSSDSDIFSDRYDVLKAAHHGSKNSSSEELLKELSPALSVISCGKNNRYGHPHKELLERLNKISSDIVRTDESGAVILTNDGTNINIQKFINDKT